MELLINRFSSGKNTTLGLFFDVSSRGLVDYQKKKWLGYTLEDEFRTRKKFGDTRIPARRYKLKVRTFGDFHNRYKKRFSFHRGMIEVLNVPNFTDILWHIGNDEDDTAGCTLFGDGQHQNITQAGRIESSTIAYSRIYKYVIDEVEAGNAWVTYLDYDFE